MSDKPNKVLYYSVLIGSFVLSAFALFITYNLVLSSHHHSARLSPQHSDVATTPNNLSETDVADWLHEILDDTSDPEIKNLKGTELTQNFTNMGLLEYERSLENNNISDDQLRFGSRNEFALEDHGINKISTHSWTVTLPIFITRKGNEEARTLEIEIEQESFNGQKEEMKITSWQMM